MPQRRLLFICSRNRYRSPTAELVFADWPDLEVASAGLNRDSEVPVTEELLEWADIVLVMEPVHRERLRRRFSRALKRQKVVCLDIPDRFKLMDPELIELLQRVVPPHLS